MYVLYKIVDLFYEFGQYFFLWGPLNEIKKAA